MRHGADCITSRRAGRQAEQLRGELEALGAAKAMQEDLRAAVEASLVPAPRPSPAAPTSPARARPAPPPRRSPTEAPPQPRESLSPRPGCRGVRGGAFLSPQSARNRLSELGTAACWVADARLEESSQAEHSIASGGKSSALASIAPGEHSPWRA